MPLCPCRDAECVFAAAEHALGLVAVARILSRSHTGTAANLLLVIRRSIGQMAHHGAGFRRPFKLWVVDRGPVFD